MADLIRMELYRMRKSRAFIVCLALAFVLALAGSPLAKLMHTLASSLSSEALAPFPASAELAGILKDPFPMMNLMLALLSLCWFFYADVENGYIKNVAGQMPMKGYTVLAKFAAAMVHSLVFAVVGIAANLLGTALVQRIAADGDVLDSVRMLFLRLLLLQSLCSALLLVVSTLRSKSLGMILAVLFGLGLTPLIYLGIDEGLGALFGKDVDIGRYMPDRVMKEDPLDTVKALLVSAVGCCLFLVPAVRIFDRKDVK